MDDERHRLLPEVGYTQDAVVRMGRAAHQRADGAEQGDEADEARGGAAGLPGRGAGPVSFPRRFAGGTHRFAAYPRCSADQWQRGGGMSESFEEYRKRVLGYLGADPLRVRVDPRGASGSRRACVTILRRRPLPARPSGTVVAHMARRARHGWRLRSAGHTRRHDRRWDEHVWSRSAATRLAPVAKSLVTGHSRRQPRVAARSDATAGLRLLRRTRKRGRQTVADFVTKAAAHDLNHLRQVSAILRSHDRPCGRRTRR